MLLWSSLKGTTSSMAESIRHQEFHFDTRSPKEESIRNNRSFKHLIADLWRNTCRLWFSLMPLFLRHIGCHFILRHNYS